MNALPMRSHALPMVLGLAVVLLALAGSVSAQQTYYKWIDADGATHYSATRPAQSRTSTVTVAAGAELATQAAAVPAPATSSANGSAALTKANADYRKRACASARQDVAAVERGAMLVSGNDVTQAKALNAEQRGVAVKAAHDRVGEFCPDGAAG